MLREKKKIEIISEKRCNINFKRVKWFIYILVPISVISFEIALICGIFAFDSIKECITSLSLSYVLVLFLEINIVVFVHEFGHWFSAQFLGIKIIGIYLKIVGIIPFICQNYSIDDSIKKRDIIIYFYGGIMADSIGEMLSIILFVLLDNWIFGILYVLFLMDIVINLIPWISGTDGRKMFLYCKR